MELILKNCPQPFALIQNFSLPLAYISGIVELYLEKRKRSGKKNLLSRNEDPIGKISFFLTWIIQILANDFQMYLNLAMIPEL